MSIAENINPDTPRPQGQKTLLVRLIELVLLASLGVLLALTFWRIGAPVNVPGIPAPVAEGTRSAVNLQILTRFDPFSRQAPIATPATEIVAETTLDLELSGAWRTDDGTGAVILKKPNGEERVYEIGETISPGVTLEDVRPGQAIISRNGVREQISLNWLQKWQGASIQPTGAQTPSVEEEGFNPIEIDAFLQVGGIRPVRNQDGTVQGFEFFARQNEAYLNKYGLFTGDRVVMINDEVAPVTPEQLYERLRDVHDGAVSLVVARRGKNVPLVLEFSQ